ncbi:MAG: 2-hydroxyacid dehydrogenase [Nitrososphaerales archaeon]
MKSKVYVTRNIPKAIEMLREHCQVTFHKREKAPSRKEIIKNIKDKDGMLCVLYDKIDEQVVNSGERLKVISSYSVGYDHIDVDAATERGIYVTYTPEVLTETTADLAFALMMAVSRRVVEGDKLVRKGKWKDAWYYDFMLGNDLHGKTLGIIGMGRIGSALVRRASGFKMKILYHNRNRLPLDREKELDVEYRRFNDLLKESDFISIHVSLSNDTYHLIDEKKLRLMKPNSYLINTSRGSVVDEKALTKALKQKWVAGAALDVFEKEPVGKDSQLLKLDNVILVPHIGSASRQTRDKMAEVAAINLLNVLKGKKPIYLVNPQVQKL